VVEALKFGYHPRMHAFGDASADARYVRRLVVLFGLAYFAQGLGQAGGLINQPLNYYLKSGLGLNPAQVSEYLAILTLPWVIKPLYGLVSDYLPLFGYRRKSWLILVNMLAALGFLWLDGLTEIGTIIAALTLTAFGIASSDVIIDALMVENGERTGMIARFQGVQWFWFRLAAILTALTGGYLASMFEPATALHVAATITMLAPIAVIVVSYIVIREERSEFSLGQAKETSQSLLQALRSPTLRIAAAFLALWCFSPAFGTPLYYHMVDNLGFDQSYIGQLDAVTAIGAAGGAYMFLRVFADKTVVYRAVFSICAAIVGILCYLALAQPNDYTAVIAIPLNMFVGMVAQIGALTIFTMAASVCPPKAAGFAFAVLMSLYNGVEQLSAVVGAQLYQHVFERQLAPLLWVAAISFVLCFPLVPLLRRLETAAGEPDGGVATGSTTA
jgi:MFS family permease